MLVRLAVSAAIIGLASEAISQCDDRALRAYRSDALESLQRLRETVSSINPSHRGAYDALARNLLADCIADLNKTDRGVSADLQLGFCNPQLYHSTKMRCEALRSNLLGFTY